MNDEFRPWLERRFDTIEEKLEAIRAHASRIDVTLARNTADVEYHIKRTDALEERVEQVAADITPIKAHVDKVKTVMWFLRWTGGVVAAAIGVWATLHELL